MSCSSSPSIRKSTHAAIRFYALVAAGCVFLAVVLAFILPFITGFIPLFSDRYDFSLLIGYGTQEDGSMSRILKITAFTIAQALISAFLATGVGLAAAFFCANRNFRMRSIVLALSSVPLCVPAVIIALGFILFFGTNGIFNTLIRFLFRIDRPIITSLFSLKGIILIHAFYNFPLAMKTITHMWERLGWEEEQAAELLGANRFRIFTTITLPALFHPVAASFLLIFLFCFFSFIIILLFGSLGVTTLEVELYKTARASLNMHFAAKIALIELITAAMVIIFYAGIQKKYAEPSGVKPLRERTALQGKAEKLFFVFTMALILFFLIAPLSAIFLHSLYNVHHSSLFNKFASLKAWKHIVAAPVFWQALLTTLSVGFCTTGITLTAAIFFAYLTLFTPPKMIFTVIPYVPLAVSSVMLGFGWFLLKPNGSLIILIIAQSALAWPFAWTHIHACMMRIPENTLYAAILLSENKPALFFRVLLPLCKSGIVAAAAFVFAISAGDASLPMILNLPRFQNLAVLLFDYAGSYRFTESSAVAVVLTLITSCVFFLQDKQYTGE